MNILFVSDIFRLFDDVDCGAGNRSTMFIKALSHLGNVDIISFEGTPIRGYGENCNVLYYKSIKSNEQRPATDKWSRRKTMLNMWKAILFHPYSPYTYGSTDKDEEAIVDSYYNKKHYDIVACRYIDHAIWCGLLKYSAKLVIDIDDKVSGTVLREIENTSFAHVWEKWYLQLKAKHIDRMVEKVLSNVRCSFYSNILEPTTPSSVFLHNVTMMTKPCSPVNENLPKRLLMVGHLNYGPNKHGAKYFADNIFPRIKAVIPDAELHIVGRNPDCQLADYLNSIEGISATGFVDDIYEEYNQSRAVIVPVYNGAGTSVKFVEALMMKRPVVTTPSGIRGYDHICKHQEHYLLSNSDEEFVDNCIQILNTPDVGNKLAKAGYHAAISNFSQERFINIVRNTVVAHV